MQVRDLLADKAANFYTIRSGQTVEEAIDVIDAQKVSALLVLESDQPVGIFAERDVLRCHLNHRGTPFNRIRVQEAMTNKLIVAEAEDQIEAAMAMMIKADIRHLPVVADKQIIGMLTISDLVKHQIGTLTAELHYLQDYIAGLQEASRD